MLGRTRTRAVQALLKGGLLLSVLALQSCAALSLDHCPAGLQSKPIAEIVFGRNIGGREGVGDADWTSFVDAEVTPRFPNGLSVFDAQGQWRAADGGLVRERSKLVLLVLSGTRDEDAKIGAIRNAYKTRFHQESVMLIRQTGCVGF